MGKHGLMVLCGVGLFAVCGCAKQEVIKKDGPLAANVSSPAASGKAAVSSEKSTAPVKQEAVAKSPQQAPAQKPSPPGDRLATALDRVFFDFDSAKLSPNARRILVRNAEAIKQKPKAKIRIEGNCDERGSDEYNLALGEKRARAAMEYLVTTGVPSERLSVISYGKEKPADPGHDEKAWAQNRRDEFVIDPL